MTTTAQSDKARAGQLAPHHTGCLTPSCCFASRERARLRLHSRPLLAPAGAARLSEAQNCNLRTCSVKALRRATHARLSVRPSSSPPRDCARGVICLAFRVGASWPALSDCACAFPRAVARPLTWPTTSRSHQPGVKTTGGATRCPSGPKASDHLRAEDAGLGSSVLHGHNLLWECNEARTCRVRSHAQSPRIRTCAACCSLPCGLECYRVLASSLRLAALENFSFLPLPLQAFTLRELT